MVHHPHPTTEFMTYLEDAVIEAELLHHASLRGLDPSDVERCFLHRQWMGNVPAARIRAHAHDLVEQGLLRNRANGTVETTPRGRAELERALTLLHGFMEETRVHAAEPGTW